MSNGFSPAECFYEYVELLGEDDPAVIGSAVI
jgi:hypothetical protein